MYAAFIIGIFIWLGVLQLRQQSVFIDQIFFFNRHNFAAKIYINKTLKKTITDLVSHSCQGSKLACVSYSLPRTIKENIEFRKITKHQQKWETSGESEDSFQLLKVREWLQLEKQGHWWRQKYDVLRKVSFFLLSPNCTFAWDKEGNLLPSHQIQPRTGF